MSPIGGPESKKYYLCFFHPNNYQTSNNYGSNLELEASPRRFRKQEIPDFYTAAPDSLMSSSYQSGRYEGSEYESLDSNIPIPSKPPPALPKRPPKLFTRSQSEQINSEVLGYQ